MDTDNSNASRKTPKIRKRIKTMEEVEMILAQEETGDENVQPQVVKESTPPMPTRMSRRTTRGTSVHETPSRSAVAPAVVEESKTPRTPRRDTLALLEENRTPRRSTRKSVRPVQEYSEIINRSLRSHSKPKGNKQHDSDNEDAENQDKENNPKLVEEVECSEEPPPRWTPAKVGRVSQKRPKRSRKIKKDDGIGATDATSKASAGSASPWKKIASRIEISSDVKEPAEDFEGQQDKGDVVFDLSMTREDGASLPVTNASDIMNHIEVPLEVKESAEDLEGQQDKGDVVFDLSMTREDGASLPVTNASGIMNHIEVSFEVKHPAKDLEGQQDKGDVVYDISMTGEDGTSLPVTNASDTANYIKVSSEVIEPAKDLEGQQGEDDVVIDLLMTGEGETSLPITNASDTANHIKVSFEVKEPAKDLADQKDICDVVLDFAVSEGEGSSSSSDAKLVSLSDVFPEDKKSVHKCDERDLKMPMEEWKSSPIPNAADGEGFAVVDTDTSSPMTSTTNQAFKHLNSSFINVSDLGIVPLDIEEEQKAVKDSEQNQEVEDDMPSLIVCDDDDEEEELPKVTNLNETFDMDSSDVILCDASTKHAGDQENETKESDGGNMAQQNKEPVAIQESVKTMTPSIDAPKSPKGSSVKCSRQVAGTSKLCASITRMPTPFKSRNPKMETEQDWHDSPCRVGITTLLEPKEYILRGIRKRSRSLGSRPHEGEKKSVRFYSPSNNREIYIDEIDHLISARKKEQEKLEKEEQRRQKQRQNLASNVTHRRKRSMSANDLPKVASRLPIPTASVPGGASPYKAREASKVPVSYRTKLPNFAAIHQKQFSKMENIVDHLERKAERAKVLTNSASKSRGASAQKRTPLKKANVGSTPVAKAKAHKSLFESVASPTSAHEREEPEEDPRDRLPNPLTAKVTPKVHVVSLDKYKNKVITVVPLKRPMMPSNQPVQKAQKQAPPPKKPAFNLSVALESQKPSVRVFGGVTATASSTSFNTGTIRKKAKGNDTNADSGAQTAQNTSVGGNLAGRRDRLMRMYKGNPLNHSATAETTQRRGAYIQGVRSNRRFELQMQHRKNLEQ